MDTKTLIADAKYRFNHNSSKNALKDKYLSKLIVAEQGGLWTASKELISFLSCIAEECANITIVDNFDNPVYINTAELRATLILTYNKVMNEWKQEWDILENTK